MGGGLGSLNEFLFHAKVSKLLKSWSIAWNEFLETPSGKLEVNCTILIEVGSQQMRCWKFHEQISGAFLSLIAITEGPGLD